MGVMTEEEIRAEIEILTAERARQPVGTKSRVPRMLTRKINVLLRQLAQKPTNKD